MSTGPIAPTTITPSSLGYERSIHRQLWQFDPIHLAELRAIARVRNLRYLNYALSFCNYLLSKNIYAPFINTGLLLSPQLVALYREHLLDRSQSKAKTDNGTNQNMSQSQDTTFNWLQFPSVETAAYPTIPIEKTIITSNLPHIIPLTQPQEQELLRHLLYLLLSTQLIVPPNNSRAPLLTDKTMLITIQLLKRLFLHHSITTFPLRPLISTAVLVAMKLQPQWIPPEQLYIPHQVFFNNKFVPEHDALNHLDPEMNSNGILEMVKGARYNAFMKQKRYQVEPIYPNYSDRSDQSLWSEINITLPPRSTQQHPSPGPSIEHSIPTKLPPLPTPHQLMNSTLFGVKDSLLSQFKKIVPSLELALIKGLRGGIQCYTALPTIQSILLQFINTFRFEPKTMIFTAISKNSTGIPLTQWPLGRNDGNTADYAENNGQRDVFNTNITHPFYTNTPFHSYIAPGYDLSLRNNLGVFSASDHNNSTTPQNVNLDDTGPQFLKQILGDTTAKYSGVAYIPRATLLFIPKDNSIMSNNSVERPDSLDHITTQSDLLQEQQNCQLTHIDLEMLINHTSTNEFIIPLSRLNDTPLKQDDNQDINRTLPLYSQNDITTLNHTHIGLTIREFERQQLHYPQHKIPSQGPSYQQHESLHDYYTRIRREADEIKLQVAYNPSKHGTENVEQNFEKITRNAQIDTLDGKNVMTLHRKQVKIVLPPAYYHPYGNSYGNVDDNASSPTINCDELFQKYTPYLTITHEPVYPKLKFNEKHYEQPFSLYNDFIMEYITDIYLLSTVYLKVLYLSPADFVFTHTPYQLGIVALLCANMRYFHYLFSKVLIAKSAGGLDVSEFEWVQQEFSPQFVAVLLKQLNAQYQTKQPPHQQLICPRGLPFYENKLLDNILIQRYGLRFPPQTPFDLNTLQKLSWPGQNTVSRTHQKLNDVKCQFTQLHQWCNTPEHLNHIISTSYNLQFEEYKRRADFKRSYFSNIDNIKSSRSNSPSSNVFSRQATITDDTNQVCDEDLLYDPFNTPRATVAALWDTQKDYKTPIRGGTDGCGFHEIPQFNLDAKTAASTPLKDSITPLPKRREPVKNNVQRPYLSQLQREQDAAYQKLCHSQQQRAQKYNAINILLDTASSSFHNDHNINNADMSISPAVSSTSSPNQQASVDGATSCMNLLYSVTLQLLLYTFDMYKTSTTYNFSQPSQSQLAESQNTEDSPELNTDFIMNVISTYSSLNNDDNTNDTNDYTNKLTKEMPIINFNSDYLPSAISTVFTESAQYLTKYGPFASLHESYCTAAQNEQIAHQEAKNRANAMPTSAPGVSSGVIFDGAYAPTTATTVNASTNAQINSKNPGNLSLPKSFLQNFSATQALFSYPFPTSADNYYSLFIKALEQRCTYIYKLRLLLTQHTRAQIQANMDTVIREREIYYNSIKAVKAVHDARGTAGNAGQGMLPPPKTLQNKNEFRKTTFNTAATYASRQKEKAEQEAAAAQAAAMKQHLTREDKQMLSNTRAYFDKLVGLQTRPNALSTKPFYFRRAQKRHQGRIKLYTVVLKHMIQFMVATNQQQQLQQQSNHDIKHETDMVDSQLPEQPHQYVTDLDYDDHDIYLPKFSLNQIVSQQFEKIKAEVMKKQRVTYTNDQDPTIANTQYHQQLQSNLAFVLNTMGIEYNFEINRKSRLKTNLLREITQNVIFPKLFNHFTALKHLYMMKEKVKNVKKKNKSSQISMSALKKSKNYQHYKSHTLNKQQYVYYDVLYTFLTSNYSLFNIPQPSSIQTPQQQQLQQPHHQHLRDHNTNTPSSTTCPLSNNTDHNLLLQPTANPTLDINILTRNITQYQHQEQRFYQITSQTKEFIQQHHNAVKNGGIKSVDEISTLITSPIEQITVMQLSSSSSSSSSSEDDQTQATTPKPNAVKVKSKFEDDSDDDILVQKRKLQKQQVQAENKPKMRYYDDDDDVPVVKNIESTTRTKGSMYSDDDDDDIIANSTTTFGGPSYLAPAAVFSDSDDDGDVVVLRVGQSNSNTNDVKKVDTPSSANGLAFSLDSEDDDPGIIFNVNQQK